MGAQSIRRVRRVLRNMLSTQPFFANLALRLVVQEDASRETVASDGENLFFNPAWVDETQADTIRAAVCRVVLACALKHHLRRGNRDYKKWQQASQEVTLPLLRNAGLTDEGGGTDDTVENVYKNLPDPPKGNDPGQQPGGGQGEQSQGGQQSGDGNQDGQGQGGSGQPSHDPNGKGEIMDAPKPEGQSQAEQDQQLKKAEQDWDEANRQAIQQCKSEGKTPGDIEELLSPAIPSADWRTILRRFMTDNAKADYTWNKPNRRHIDSGLYLPDLKSESMPPIILAIDTSGSLSSKALNMFWAEIREIVEDLQPERLTIIQCDTQIQSEEHYDPTDLPGQLTVHGRGGTRFNPVFERLPDLPHASCLIYFTDLCCEHFGEEPDYPVLWAIEEADYESGYFTKPPFGEIVALETADTNDDDD